MLDECEVGDNTELNRRGSECCRRPLGNIGTKLGGRLYV